MSAERENKKHRIIPLEALRGIAALIVVLHHFCLAYLPGYIGIYKPPGPDTLIGLPVYVVMNGRAMQIVFFVLSGYVLALKGLRPDAGRVLADAAIKRWFRLVPLVCLSAFLSYLLFTFHLYHYEEAARISHSQFLIRNAFTPVPQHNHPSLAWTLYQGLFGVMFVDTTGLNSNLWTMRWEFYGSMLVFALASLLAPEHRKILFPLIGVCAIAVFFQAMWMFPFLIGLSGVALHFHIRRLSSLVTSAALALGLYLCGYYYPQKFYQWAAILPFDETHSQILILSCGGFLLLSVFATDNAVSRFFTGFGSRLLGKISFPLYLIHTLIIGSFSADAYIAAEGGPKGVACAAITLFAVAALPVWFMMRLDGAWLKLLAGWHPARRAETV